MCLNGPGVCNYAELRGFVRGGGSGGFGSDGDVDGARGGGDGEDVVEGVGALDGAGAGVDDCFAGGGGEGSVDGDDATSLGGDVGAVCGVIKI